jgi:hypothetical protein
MTRAEISSLFYLQYTINGMPVENFRIGDGVYISRLDDDWLENLKLQCPRVAAREQLEYRPYYTHRLFIEIAVEEEWGYLREPTLEEKQPILLAIALSRIVKPTSIPYSNVWVKSFYHDSGKIEHYSEPVINSHSVAYVEKDEELNTITEDDVSIMAELWDSLRYLLNDQNEPKYRRLVRAFKLYELAHAVFFRELVYPTYHAALESMICSSWHFNKAQVTQRLPRLVPFVSTQQALDIYTTCGDIKHAAEALQQQPLTAIGTLTPSDQRRLDAAVLLRQAVRDLLLRVLRDRTLADTLADPNLLKQAHPVLDQNGKLLLYKGDPV